MGDKARQALEELVQEELLKQDEHAPINAPQHEVPSCPMPDTGKSPYHHGIEDKAWGLDAVATKRDVDIVAKEPTERHVPTSPELGGALREVGVVEVPGVIEAHHLAKTDGHIRIAREIKVNLEGIGGNP